MTMDFLTHITIHCGDVMKELRKLPAKSAHCVVTSPPYWALRDYGFDGQLGLEATPKEYLRNMVKVFRQVRRVLRDDGTLWLNMGDGFAGNGTAYGIAKSTLQGTKHAEVNGARRKQKRGNGLKPKDLIGIPWRFALALQADGWYLRSDIIWHKPNGMPSSVTDRCTTNHEYLFMLAKSERYYFDQQSIKEEATGNRDALRNRWDRDVLTPPGQKPQKRAGRRSGNVEREYAVNVMNPDLARNIPREGTTRNKRSVWSVATDAYGDEHFAVFPPKLIEPCILAGCPPGGTVLDCFAGTGTTAGVAVSHGRKAILIEGNPKYVHLIPHRVEQVVRKLKNAPAPAPQPKNQATLF
jgi:DNA modification methylase